MAVAMVTRDESGRFRSLPPLVGAYGPKPLWRGRLHALAFLAVIPLGIGVVATSAPGAPRVALTVYLLTLAGLFGASASYHLFAHTPRTVRWLRRLDHSMIFLLIAGTYTPLCLVALPPTVGIPVLAVVWAAAAGGVVMKMIRVREGQGASGSWLYGVLGAGGVLVLPWLASVLTVWQLVLLLGGGALYGIGASVLARRRPDPLPAVFGYHEVWHAFTIGAGACHFLLIVLLVP